MNINQILRQSGLNCTPGRRDLLDVLINARIPLSEKEIEEKMKLDCNKTTVYRNLSRLVEKGVLYRIIDDKAVKFKFAGNGYDHQKTVEHVHFKCTVCEKMVCLYEVPVQTYSLPEGFTGKENQFMIVGICKDCNKKDEER